MAKTAPFIGLILSIGTFLLAAPLLAIQPSEKVLPASTKGFIETPNFAEAEAKFNTTQIGELIADPAMQPFVEDLKRQLKARLDKAGTLYGVTWEDLKSVQSGEVAVAAIQPDAKDKNSHASALLIDVTGKEEATTKLLAKIAAHQAIQKGVKSTHKTGSIEVTSFTHPLKTGETAADQVAHFVHEGQLVLTDNVKVAGEIAGHFGGDGKNTLSQVAAFQHVMQRNEKAAGGAKANIRWFIEPFGYTEVSRAASTTKRKRGRDLLKILASQGFDAVQGLGGNIFFSTESEEILHRTFIYAPAVVRKADDKNKDKYDLAMRMLNFPNGDDLAPPSWIPQDVAAYLTFRAKLKDAFNFSETLVDEYAGDKGVFKAMWENMALDPSGPMINIHKELVDHLGERVILISDVKVPVDLKSERLIVSIELLGPKGPAIVQKTLQKAFESDPSAKKREFQGHVIWELLNEEAGAEPELTVEGDGFVAVEEGDAKPAKKSSDEEDGTDDEEEEEEKPILPNMAFTVVNGQLFIGTHVEFMEEVIGKANSTKPLASHSDFGRIEAALTQLGAGSDSFRFFTRTDESYRGTYELLKQGKLPEAETVFARLLNGILGSGEKGVVRKSEVDGSKLPDFAQVQKYLGPAGFYVHSEDDGWFLVGCLLKKTTK